MVAPAYAEHRRTVAQRIGLGSRKGAAAESPSSTDDQLDAVAPVDSQGAVPQAGFEAEKKPRRATAAKKTAGVRGPKKGAPSNKAPSATASDLALATQVDQLSEASAAVDAQVAQSEVAAPSDPSPKPIAKTRSSKSGSAKAPASGRGKAKASQDASRHLQLRLLSTRPTPPLICRLSRRRHKHLSVARGH
jgi:hypothetical protein